MAKFQIPSISMTATTFKIASDTTHLIYQFGLKYFPIINDYSIILLKKNELKSWSRMRF